jgi:hypothetical protein
MACVDLVVLALIVLAIALSRSGWMARSAVATRYQLGLVFHAAAETFSANSIAAVGARAANRTLFFGRRQILGEVVLYPRFGKFEEAL